uniref:HMG box domain-containing protein n=1 Tax=Elphidium margaritaceum TaxID=933848 RepID=A0A7S0XLM7_9EUKA|mmetsp:Transcript_200/g.311  ORF Transcript_200/g.311 Transcript_200/m.311 type:complete len:262 (+) Transcript_200:23-808(+)
MSHNHLYIDCPKCKSTLQYHTDAPQWIRCPSCQYVTNPTVPQQIPCVSCHTLLTFPPHSLYIRCPKCFVTSVIRDHEYRNQLISHHGPKYDCFPKFVPFTPLTITPSLNGGGGDGEDGGQEEKDLASPDIVEKDIIYSLCKQRQSNVNQLLSKYASAMNSNRMYKFFNEHETMNTESDIAKDDNEIVNHKNSDQTRRIVTGYQCFVNEHKAELSKHTSNDNDDIHVSQQLAALWKQQSAEQKKAYRVKAQQIADEHLTNCR